jgi:predicted metal-dependent enzyme (double-stranded beta helix superfamily)
MFETERFVEDCRLALAEDRSHKGVREVLARAVATPGDIVAAFGEPTEARVDILHHSPDLTALHVVWAPHMSVRPHDHNMWAVIGIYGGGEDNIFWRRTEDGIEAAGAEAIRTGDAVPLGPSIVHSVTNPLDKFTGAIHVYGGDFFAAERSEWDPENFAEMPYSMEETKRLFSEANARHKALATA